MKRLHTFFTIALMLLVWPLAAQVVVTDPAIPIESEPVTITFDASQGSGGLQGYTGNVYAHTGVITDQSTSGSDWKYVIADWGVNVPEALLTNIGTDLYELEITPSIREYYGVPDGEEILQMAFVFRSEEEVGGQWLTGKMEDGSDIFVDVFTDGLNVTFVNPTAPLLVELNEQFTIEAEASEADWIKLYIDNVLVEEVTTSTLTYQETATVAGRHDILVEAGAGTQTVEKTTYYFARGPVVEEPLPGEVKMGVNYNSSTSVTLVLNDPSMMKEHVFVLGDFNDWEYNSDYYMKKATVNNENYWWITIDGLTSGQEYAYQYMIDGELALPDPYSNKVLDPWNDQYIPDNVYPDLMPYPEGGQNIVSVLQTDQTEYQWQITDFERPAVADLVIYELHFRDFTVDGDIGYIEKAMEKLDYLEELGVNAIELMPINEFEGNDSWGYNPSFYFAADKAYGTETDYKEFIDACHERGMAVIIDMVLNHSFGQSPFLQMYMNPDYTPTEHNPWYNEACPHPPWCWGADFNHLSTHTQELVDSVNHFWLTEFNVDGFRFDFTKGFTNIDDGNGGWNYNTERIGLITRMYDEVREYDDDAYMILEHLTDNSEETELANYGLFLWGNMNHAYTEASMGWNATSDLSWASYQNRGWTYPNLITYMESHDEERMMYKNLQYGNSNPPYDIQDLATALDRVELAAAFFFTIPGPKMIWQFGELGYDVSIDDPCRVCQKPVHWEYTQDEDRQDVYKTFAELAYLKTNYAPFHTDNFDLSVGNFAMKRINLYHDDFDVVVIGNFDVESGLVNPNFPNSGTWYEYFTQQQVEITDPQGDISLEAGEYRIYTSEYVPKPDISVGVEDEIVSQTQGEHFTSFPNPVSDELKISFETESLTDVVITVYNIYGQQVEVISHQAYQPGQHLITWAPNDANGQHLAPGMYFIEVKTDHYRETQRIMVQ